MQKRRPPKKGICPAGCVCVVRRRGLLVSVQSAAQSGASNALGGFDCSFCRAKCNEKRPLLISTHNQKRSHPLDKFIFRLTERPRGVVQRPPEKRHFRFFCPRGNYNLHVSRGRFPSCLGFCWHRRRRRVMPNEMPISLSLSLSLACSLARSLVRSHTTCSRRWRPRSNQETSSRRMTDVMSDSSPASNQD